MSITLNVVHNNEYKESPCITASSIMPSVIIAVFNNYPCHYFVTIRIPIVQMVLYAQCNYVNSFYLVEYKLNTGTLNNIYSA